MFKYFFIIKINHNFAPTWRKGQYMADVAQLVRALVCGTRGRGFEPHLPPANKALCFMPGAFSLL